MIEVQSRTGDHTIATVDDAPDSRDRELSFFGAGDLDSFISNIELFGFVDSDLGTAFAQCERSMPLTDPDHLHSQSPQADGVTQYSSPVLSQVLPYNVRSFVQRSGLKTGPQRIVNLIRHTLKSYPQMLLQHGVLPPFIHPSLIFQEYDEVNMEPLANCMSLMHMFNSGVRGSRKLFWKNVKLECERFRDKVWIL